MDTLYKTLSDEDIVKTILNNSNTVLFTELYHRYKIKVQNKCMSIVKDKDIAEELRQDIFLKAYEKLSGFRLESRFSTWLYAITYNTCIEHLRYKRKTNCTECLDQTIVEIADDVNYDDTSEILTERLNNLLINTNPEERILLMMKYKDNLSIKTIQSTLNISESALKMRLKRAKARIIHKYNQIYKNT